ncbi:hypothetical protein QJS10_CPB18g00467 [Acorus calamus]|uniref:Uncharacterized protein n=1 Tax=Acorus calamus TaxID=4465 RepID=A0AAV9CM20_ACOCL|nr:hypothetical protein QJS10_CPB18g00467 [Acorus calamus]
MEGCHYENVRSLNILNFFKGGVAASTISLFGFSTFNCEMQTSSSIGVHLIGVTGKSYPSRTFEAAQVITLFDCPHLAVAPELHDETVL